MTISYKLTLVINPKPYLYVSSLYFLQYTVAHCTIFYIVNVQLQQLQEVETRFCYDCKGLTELGLINHSLI